MVSLNRCNFPESNKQSRHTWSACLNVFLRCLYKYFIISDCKYRLVLLRLLPLSFCDQGTKDFTFARILQLTICLSFIYIVFFFSVHTGPFLISFCGVLHHQIYRQVIFAKIFLLGKNFCRSPYLIIFLK